MHVVDQILSRHDVDDYFVSKTQIIGVMLVQSCADYVAIVLRIEELMSWPILPS